MELTQEQIDNLIDAFNKVAEVVKEVWKKIKEVFTEFINNINFEELNKINKYSKIYMRTHNQRIKKKQICKILKLLE